MVTSKDTIDIIRKIIQKHYARLVVSVLGRDQLTPDQKKQLEESGYDTSNPDSLLSMVYYHNFINHPVDEQSPKNIQDMKSQQSVPGLKPTGEAHDYTVENINEKMAQYIDKMRMDVQSKIEAMIRENNDSYKMDALKNLDRSVEMDELVKESTLGKLRQKLKDSSKDGTRDWLRVAVTEMSNAIGIGSVDRIVTENRNNDLDDVYVYREIVQDERTCKYCRRFYEDSDGSPKVYKLSTLLSNGSNYGKPRDSWLPVAGATHPNERCSQVLELKPGWALEGDTITYIGLDRWNDYIFNKVSK
jgi:hypothetical protein